MKKSILALAVLGAFAGAASAQSSVTIYGKLNLEAGKAVASGEKALMDVAGSRLGFRGVEDLGGGLKATFGIEHRFSPQTGAAAANFWNGFSTVGLQGNFGHVRIGRDYTPAFLMIQNQIDPFGGDTQGALRDVGMRAGYNQVSTAGANYGYLTGGVTQVRSNAMVEYHISANGFNFGAQIAESNANTTSGGTKRPYSLAANYAAGPLFVGVGIENPSGAKDNSWALGGRYNFGFMTASLGLSSAKNNLDTKFKGVLVGVNVPVGALDVKAGYAQQKMDSSGLDFTGKKFSIGLHYNLSKRTKVFADIARVNDDGAAVLSGYYNSAAPTAAQRANATEKTGYDFGIQHNF